MSQGQTRYFFCARLKYSRFTWVRFEANMQEETLLRCLVDCFVALGGVAWAVVSDNMKTVVLGRDEQHQPRWNKAYLKLATEFEFHPELCAPASGNQKGSVENLVKFVKGNFVAGRTFYDEADLAHQLGNWLHTVNTERKSEATGQIPAHLLRLEQPHFGPLPPHSRDYGLFHSVTVSRESLVCFETNFYSVPVAYVGQNLTLRVYRERLELYWGDQQVASHPRARGHKQRVVQPDHFEAVFEAKPRARVMVYRDFLVGLGQEVLDYVSVICRKRRSEMNEQIVALYDLARRIGQSDFVVAVGLAAEQNLYGAEYLTAITSTWAALAFKANTPSLLSAAPLQKEVERALGEYEAFVANRVAVAARANGSQDQDQEKAGLN
jgi:hypothetical protein